MLTAFLLLPLFLSAVAAAPFTERRRHLEASKAACGAMGHDGLLIETSEDSSFPVSRQMVVCGRQGGCQNAQAAYADPEDLHEARPATADVAHPLAHVRPAMI